jgi:hypothetical protein
MKLEEVLPALRDGKKIYRKISPHIAYIDPNILPYHRDIDLIIDLEDLLADDWEIEDEK